MSERLLLKNKLYESENIIFIRPHAQYPVRTVSAGGQEGWGWSDTAEPASFLPETMKFIELVGRVCYKSESRITDTSSAKFVKMIVESGHHSVIEHASATVKYVGTRAMSHQLVRHRLASYSQESQRYCNYGKRNKLYAVMPPGIYNGEAGKAAREAFVRSMEEAYGRYRELLAQGVRAEDARGLLPNATKTEVVATLNLRQWRHVVEERGLNAAAQWEIRMITLGVLESFRDIWPVIFGDLWQRKEDAGAALVKDLNYAL